MAVKDFLEIKNPMLTTEKEVARKPTIAELTTIEQPGRPAPATNLEEPEKQANKKKPVKKKQAKKQIPEEKNATLIITEKPQAAEKIAYALGQPRKYTERGASYYELIAKNKRILVASAVGHLFTLEQAKGQKGWPIYNVIWQPATTRAPFIAKYITLLEALAKEAQAVIIATDYDTEGEVIGWNVLRFICKEKEAQRMHYSTLTKDELLHAFNNPEPHLNWGNAYAGEARHIVDWLYGINLSRALMTAIKTSGSFKVLSIGRVQGPALKMIVDREHEITSFISQPYWQVLASTAGHQYMHPKDIYQKEELADFTTIKKANAKTTHAQERTAPGTPFDLTTLQRESARVCKLSPGVTLQTAQKLYLAGVISYPRTSSQKIPDAIKPLEIIKKLAKRFPEAKLATRKKPLEGSKTDPAHPSIYPTGEYASLSDQEEKLYNLIVKRFLACFAEELVTNNTRTVLTADNGKTFTANAKQIAERGWTAFYPYEIEETSLPELNGPVTIDRIETQEKQTQPPARYSATSLITAMEKKNLGTKTTRSMIIETLFERGYLDGKSITATPLGMKLIEALNKYAPIIIDEQLTSSIEESMEAIEKNALPAEKEKTIEQAKAIIEKIAGEFKKQETAIGKTLAEGLTELRKEQQEANTLMLCPTCKTGNLRILFNRAAKRSFIACSNYPTCKQTYSLPPNALIKKAGKTCEADGFPKLLAIRKAKRPWEFCFNPTCPLEQAKKEQWVAKKQENVQKEE